jgi:charged multivesicular body protein 4
LLIGFLGVLLFFSKTPRFIDQMELANRWFGRAKNVDPTTTAKTLRSTLDTIQKRIEFLETRSGRELEAARRYAKTNKRLAIAALKRKQTYQKQIDSLSGAMVNIEQQLTAIEASTLNQEVIGAMRLGANAMQTMHKGIDQEKVEETMLDISDQMDLANEISSRVSQPLGSNATDFDDDELDAELEALEQEDLDAQLLTLVSPPTSASTTATAPISSARVAPVSTSTAATTTDRRAVAVATTREGKTTTATTSAEEDELEQLGREMAM